MAKIVKTLTVSWQWSGDKYSLRGFNLAVTPTAKNPKEEVVATAFVETNEIKQTYSYKMGNVTLDKDAQYKIWVQAVYENSDSDWVSTGGATVTDDGSATIITKTDREIQDIVNMASDNILTRQEKVGLRREWQEIVYEFLEIESTAVGQGIPSSNAALSNFKSKGNALGTYLNGGTAWAISSSNKTSFPLWINDSNLGSNTSINGNTYRETFRAYYEAKVKILEEIGTHKIDNVQIGATNIIRNSSNPKTLTHWKSGTGFSVAKSELLGENVFRILTTDATEKYGSTDRYKVEPNCQYTFAMDVYMDANVTSLDVFWLSRAKGSTSDYDSVTHFIQAWKDTKSKWVRITGTFTTKATDYEGYIRIDNNGTTNSTTLNGLWFTKVKLEKGNKPTDWSPALEDMENAYTIVLTNEAQVIPTNSSRVPTSSTVYHTDIQVYQGTTQRTDYTIGTVNSANGITVSKTSSRVSFSVSTETALTVDGGNFTIPITIDGKTFNKTFSWSCSKQGNVGNSGVGISSITEYYAVSSSNTTAPTSWSTTVPTMTSTNKYLWNYEAIKYTNNTTKETAKRVIGAYGDKGATGGTGATGNGISNITNYYLATSSSSGVTTSTSGWTTSVQSVSSSKKYLWNYEVVTYTNGSTNTTTPCIIGTYGDKGDKGDQGDAYTVLLTNENHTFPCANNGNIASAISTTTTVTAYKGATSVTPTIGTLPSVTGLTLSKSGATVTVQANTGTSLAEHGSFNIPVTVDGKSFTKTFSWSKSKQGATGLAKSADIMATGQVFKSSDGGATYTPSAITLTPSLQNVSFSNWQYSTTGTGSWTTVVSGQNGLTISGNALAISKDSPLFTKTQTSMVFRLNTNDSAIYDTMTIVKLNDMAEVVIGGRNLVSKSYVAKRNSAGSFDDATNTWTLTATAGNTDTWGCGLAISGNKVLVPYGQTYVLSFEIKVPRTCSWNTDVNNYAASGSSWSGNDNDEGSKRKTSSKSLVANQWVKCWLSWSNTHSSNTNKVDLYDNTNFGIVMKNETSDMTFQIRNVKGELGTVPTDWSPAPIDVANDISTAQNAAASAQNTANSAKTEATNATSKLNEIASDSKLTASEKQQVSRDWEEIKLEKPSIINQANVYSISTTAFTNAYTALETYVGTLNLTSTATTTITPSDFKSKFNTYYTQRQAILDEVAKKAKKHADDLVANVNIGGRNYLKGTTNGITVVGNNASNQCATVGRLSVPCANLDKRPYTLVVKYKVTSSGTPSGSVKLQAGGDLWGGIQSNTATLSASNTEGTLTASSTLNLGSKTFSEIQVRCDNMNGTVKFYDAKYELGNKSTDWSPAPEDTTATIDGLRLDVETMINGVQNQVDGKVETFYQENDPASAWTTTDLKNAHKGDIWYKTTDKMTYRYSGTGWVKLADGDAESAKNLASSKKRVFTATPTVPYEVGDLWVTALNETGDLKVCKTARTNGSYTASDWVKATDYIDSTQAGNIAQGKVDAQTQASIFNKLTNNGATQGIYLDGGKIYINGEYIQTGTLRADLVKVQVDGKENILPFNYVTFKSGIESWLEIGKTNKDIPYIEMEVPIYSGGGDIGYYCRKVGSSTVVLEPNTRYFFSCDLYVNVPRSKVAVCGVGGATGTGAELTLMTAESARYVTEGRYTPIFKVTSLTTGTTNNQWTHKVYEFTTPSEPELYSLSNHLYIELNGSSYNAGGYGYIRIANMALEKATTNQTTASKFDYLQQIKERRIELTDNVFYKTGLGIDGFCTEEGIIEGTTTTNGLNYLINYDGMKSYKSPRERFFIGKDKGHYSYEAGSTGVISGHDDIYGVGGVHLNTSTNGDYRGVFIGVHNGYQIPDSTEYGRPDIYVHNGQWGMDFSEWDLLGRRVEPLGLVRRDDFKNIETNHQLKFSSGGGTSTANLWNQEQHNRTGNGQMMTYSAGHIYVSNPQTPLILEGSSIRLNSSNGVALSNSTDGNRLKIQGQYGSLTIGSYNSDWCHFNTDRSKFYFDKQVSVCGEIYAGSGYNQRVFHQGWSPKSGNYWSGGAAFVNTDGVMEIGKYIDFHNANNGTEDYSVRLCVDANNKNTVYLPNDNGRLYNTGNHGCKRLANGAWYMTGSQSVGLSDTVWNQAHGIVLVFSAYNPSSGQTYQFDWHTYFVPKTFFTDRESAEGYVLITTFLTNPTLNNIGTKHIRVYNNRVTGDDRNTQSGSGSGISFKNNEWVLRYVYGV